MRDLISRSALIEELGKGKRLVQKYKEYTGEDAYNHVITTVNEQPTVEAKPVVTGEWVQEGNAVYHWRHNCSICGNPVYDKIKPYNFCPNCGADMRGGKNE